MGKKKNLSVQTTFKIPGRPDFVKCGPLEAFKEKPTHIHVVTKPHPEMPLIAKSEEVAVVMLEGGGECFNEQCWINTLCVNVDEKRITKKVMDAEHELVVKRFKAIHPGLFP